METLGNRLPKKIVGAVSPWPNRIARNSRDLLLSTDRDPALAQKTFNEVAFSIYGRKISE